MNEANKRFEKAVGYIYRVFCHLAGLAPEEFGDIKNTLKMSTTLERHGVECSDRCLEFELHGEDEYPSVSVLISDKSERHLVLLADIFQGFVPRIQLDNDGIPGSIFLNQASRLDSLVVITEAICQHPWE